MPSPPADAATPSRMLHMLDTALDQSHDVMVEVEAEVSAEYLGSANDLATPLFADGVTMLPAAQALRNGLDVELRVQACADDLRQVTENLAHGVDEVKAVELALNRSHAAPAESEAALAVSRSAERTASQNAMHDQKTGLPKRTLFDDRLAQAIAGAERQGWLLAVMFLDLDRFKLVSDTHRHAAGDSVLAVVAERLMREARDEDSVCRNRGDEFLYLLINPSGREAVARIAGLVRQAIGSPVGLGALHFPVTPEHRHRALPRARHERADAGRECRRRDVPGQAALQPLRVLRAANRLQHTFAAANELKRMKQAGSMAHQRTVASRVDYDGAAPC